jgi:membrane fusion protein, multidrug efflux system
MALRKQRSNFGNFTHLGKREVVIGIAESRVDELRRARARRIAARCANWRPTDSVTRTYSARITVHDADARELMLGMTASVWPPTSTASARSACR